MWRRFPEKRMDAASYMEKDDANEDLPPKRNMSAFFHFGNDLRKQLMADDPSLTFTTVAPVISSKWKEADEKTKADYEEKARLDKERYLKEKEEYDKRMKAKAAEEAAQEAAKASKRARVTDENAPKRNMSASAQAPLELET